MTKTYEVAEIPRGSGIWAVPQKTITRLKLTENQDVILTCGASSVQARVVQFPPDQTALRMFLSRDLMGALGLPPGVRLQIKPAGKREFRLGPVIGILVFSRHIPNRLDYYTSYALIGKNIGLIHVFRRSSIDTARHVINGYYFDQAIKAWKPAILPFPDAVIDRRYPNSDKTHKILEKVIGPNRIFNKQTLISKTQFARVMGKDSYLSRHVPETRILTGPTDLNYFLGKYGSVVLKPATSMKGHGIIMINAVLGKLRCKFKENGKDVVMSFNSSASLSNILKRAGGRDRSYIIQQAITSMNYKDSPFSLRICPTKNGQGQWKIPGMLALGCGNSFITNYSSGAKAIPLHELFSSVIPRLRSTRAEFFELLNNLSIQTAKLLDKRFGPLGELGIDIILDQTGKPWILEANGNPGRIPIFYQKEYPAWPFQLFQYPLAYASLLAGFTCQ